MKLPLLSVIFSIVFFVGLTISSENVRAGQENATPSVLENLEASLFNVKVDESESIPEIVNRDDYVSISYLGSLEAREKIGFAFGILNNDIPIDITNGMILRMEIDKGGQTFVIEGTILNTSEHDYSYLYSVFNLPENIEGGTWRIKQLTFLDGSTELIFNRFQDNILSSDEFFVPEVEADEWVRSALSSRLYTDDVDDIVHVKTVGGGYMPINSFIQQYQLGLPPYSKEVTYNGMMKYANKTGDPYGEEINFYSLYKEGIIYSEVEPRIPIQVYNFGNEISLKNTNKIDIYVTEVLHYLINLHNPDNKISAYIVSPNGKEYKIENFVYDEEFDKFDLPLYQKGGWIGSFVFPNDAVNGNWTIKKVDLETKSEKITLVNGTDFYNATYIITGGRDSVSPSVPEFQDEDTGVIDQTTQQEYKLIGSQQNVHPNKDWTIEFTLKLDESTINNQNLFIVHKEKKLEGIKVSLNEDKKSVKVEAPENGYLKGEKYTLFIGKGIKTTTGKVIDTPIKFEFTIEK